MRSEEHPCPFQPDRSNINMHEPYQVKYWTRTFDLSKEDLQKAMSKTRLQFGGGNARYLRPDATIEAAARSEPISGRPWHDYRLDAFFAFLPFLAFFLDITFLTAFFAF